VWTKVVIYTSSVNEVQDFFHQVLGVPTRRRGGGLEIGWEMPIIEVREGERELPGGYIYHVAIKVPTREDLGAFIRRLLHDYPEYVEGFADHIVSEAVYLKSPDGVGFEVYVDRPRESWVRKGVLVAMDTLPLDLESLVRGVTPSPLPRGAVIGHIHMKTYVDLERAVGFYRGLGMEVTWKMPDAVFLAWDGYHHHLAFNKWPLPKPRGSVVAVYTSKVASPLRDPLGLEILPGG